MHRETLPMAPLAVRPWDQRHMIDGTEIPLEVGAELIS